MTPARERPELSRNLRLAIQVGPFGLLVVAAALAALPHTRRAAHWVFYDENGPAELLTFGLLALAGVRSLTLRAQIRKLGTRRAAAAFYAVFGIGLVLAGMEEIAWGQWFFHWDTPEAWRAINAQDETTLHNLTPIQGKTEYFRIAFGLGGLIGIWCARVPAFSAMYAPALLGPMFALIAAHSGADLLLDYAAPQSLAEKAFTRTSELVEMYVGVAGWLYVELNARRLRTSGAAAPRQVVTPPPAPR